MRRYIILGCMVVFSIVSVSVPFLHWYVWQSVAAVAGIAFGGVACFATVCAAVAHELDGAPLNAIEDSLVRWGVRREKRKAMGSGELSEVE